MPLRIRAAQGPHEVTLTQDQFLQAGLVGVKRRASSIYKGLAHVHSMDDRRDGWTNDLEGAMAELAFAIWLGIDWSAGVDTFKAADVGGFQVRHTGYQGGSLILRPKDDAFDTYVLMVGLAPSFRVAGWLVGKDGMEPRWWTDKGNNREQAWFVPQKHLWNPDLLR